jgi:hypothetical protein
MFVFEVRQETTRDPSKQITFAFSALGQDGNFADGRLDTGWKCLKGKRVLTLHFALLKWAT